MAVKVLELHHHGIRVGPSTEDLSKALAFYRDVLGLTPDPGRPEIPGIPGYWMDLGHTQIHLMGVSGPSKYAKGERQDPSLTHVALAVPERPGGQARAGPARRQILDVGRRSGAASRTNLHGRPVW